MTKILGKGSNHHLIGTNPVGGIGTSSPLRCFDLRPGERGRVERRSGFWGGLVFFGGFSMSFCWVFVGFF